MSVLDPIADAKPNPFLGEPTDDRPPGTALQDGASVFITPPVADPDPGPGGSIFTSAPSSASPAGAADFGETRMDLDADAAATAAAAATAGSGAAAFGVRSLGGPAAGVTQRVFVGLVVVGLLLLLLSAGQALVTVTQGAVQVATTGDALMHSQRLAKLTSQALQGTNEVFPGVRESASVMTTAVRNLRDGGGGVAALPAAYGPALTELATVVERTHSNNRQFLQQ
jgi:twitching motility protein PilJ